MTIRNFDDLAFFSNGEPIMIQEKEGLVQASFKKLIVMAIGARYDEDRNISPAELFKRGKLADKLDAGGDIQLESTDLTILKDYVAKAWPPRVISVTHDKIETDYQK